MKTEFTPGPWVFRTEIGTVNAIDPIHSQDGRARIEICDPSSGQTWNGEMLPIDERTANARLIAAAPRMIDSLQRAYSVLANIHNEWQGRHTRAGQQLLCDMRDTISAALNVDAEQVQDSAYE